MIMQVSADRKQLAMKQQWSGSIWRRIVQPYVYHATIMNGYSSDCCQGPLSAQDVTLHSPRSTRWQDLKLFFARRARQQPWNGPHGREHAFSVCSSHGRPEVSVVDEGAAASGRLAQPTFGLHATIDLRGLAVVCGELAAPIRDRGRVDVSRLHVAVSIGKISPVPPLLVSCFPASHHDLASDCINHTIAIANSPETLVKCIFRKSVLDLINHRWYYWPRSIHTAPGL